MSKLKVTILSVAMGAGTSSKSGQPKPYKFSTVAYLNPASDFLNDQHNIQKCGFEVKEVSMAYDAGLYQHFKSNCPFNNEVYLLLEADPENPARNIVSGFELIKS